MPPASELTRSAADAASVRGGENFPVALRALPREPRGHLVALYGYARWVDDLGDRAAGGPARRLTLLDAVDADLDRLDAGQAPRLPVVVALAATVRAKSLPTAPLRDLVAANRMDQEISRYPTWEDLRAYCRLSADPVGRLVLGIAGAATPRRVELSDDVCTALQVLEHLQDIREDARTGRVYLPVEDQERFGVGAADLTQQSASAALRALVGYETDRAAGLLGSGTELVRSLHGWARVAVSGFVGGGLATVAALRRAGHDPLAAPVKPGTRDTAVAALRLLAGRSAR